MKNQESNKIQEMFESFPQLTLRQLAIQTDNTYNVLLRESKRPVAGQIYNPETTNYLAIQTSMIKKMGVDQFNKIDFESIVDNLEIRTPKQTDWEVQNRVTFRNFGGNFTIILKTSTHLVFQEDGSTQPRVMSFDTFNHQGPKEIK